MLERGIRECTGRVGEATRFWPDFGEEEWRVAMVVEACRFSDSKEKIKLQILAPPDGLISFFVHSSILKKTSLIDVYVYENNRKVIDNVVLLLENW